MTQRLNTAALLAAAAVSMVACSPQADRQQQVRAPAVVVLGEPVSCIQTSRIRNTTVHDDYTIDFEMSGSAVYRNTLPARCPGLGFEERFAHQTTTGQLCRVDTITVLQQGGSGRGPTCGLGSFVPVRYADAGA